MVEGCITLLSSSYFCSMAVLSSNRRRWGGSAGGVGLLTGIRGGCLTVAVWVSLSRRRGVRVPGGKVSGVGARLL